MVYKVKKIKCGNLSKVNLEEPLKEIEEEKGKIIDIVNVLMGGNTLEVQIVYEVK